MSTNDAVRVSESASAHARERETTRSERTLRDVQDPRDDLEEDSLLWTRLLRMAWLDHGDVWGTNVTAALDYMRCCGLQLHTLPGKPGYVMKPLLTKKRLDKDGDPTWGDSQWAFEADYKKDREEVLLPHREEVMRYLTQLWDEDTADADGSLF